ncbi:MAG: DUF3391 domain-containing protein, partial [Gammaproteobacteria bacterium]
MLFNKDKKRKKPATIKVTESNLQKIPARDLQPGMYVAELDIPWEESPFMFQGFKLKTWEDVDAVIECCRQVTVDFRQTKIIKLPRNEIGDQRYSSTGKIQRTASTQQEITRANKTYKHASGLVNNMMDDIRLGKAIDTKAAKEVVSDAVD